MNNPLVAYRIGPFGGSVEKEAALGRARVFLWRKGVATSRRSSMERKMGRIRSPSRRTKKPGTSYLPGGRVRAEVAGPRASWHLQGAPVRKAGASGERGIVESEG